MALHCVQRALTDTSLMPSRLTVAVLMLDIETEWMLNALLTTSSSYRKCSKRRISGHSAQATSLLPIEGTTKCSRIARGFGCGRILGSAAEVNPKAGFGFRASCRLSRLGTDRHAGFPGGNCTRWCRAPFTAHCFNSYVGDAIFSVWRRLRQCPPAPTNLQREGVKAVL
jgi:hypothetical protein